MTDVVVTVPKGLWTAWIGEGDEAPLFGAGEWTGEFEYGFNLYGPRPRIEPGDRVYIVAHGKLRGFAPLIELEENSTRFEGRGHGYALVRRGGAVAVTIAEPIRGFQGWRYRWWKREEEIAFPGWRIP